MSWDLLCLGETAAGMGRRMLAGLPPPRVLHLSGITAALSESCADLVIVGWDEAELLWGAGADPGGAGPAGHAGGQGWPGGRVRPPGRAVAHGAPAVPVVEPVGAGDAFAAGYLWGVLSDAEPAARLRLGHLVAGAALRVAGDLGRSPPAAALRAARGDGS